MKLTLRSTLLSILLAINLITLAAVGFSSYYYGRKSAESLLEQVLDEMSRDIYGHMLRPIDAAADQTKLNAELLQNGTVAPDDFSRLAHYWLDVMQVTPELSFIYLGLESDGGLVGVARHDDGRLYVQEVRRDPLRVPKLGGLVLKNYWPEDYPDRPHLVSSGDEVDDPRGRPWYVRARDAGRPTWTDTYGFRNRESRPGVPGASYAAPFFGDDEKLRGVVTADIEAHRLCRYLGTLDVGAMGFAFVLELLPDGGTALVAHPDQRAVFHEAPDGKSSPYVDERVARFREQLPATIQRGDDTAFVPISFDEAGTHYIGGYQYVRGQDTPEWLISIVLPEGDVMFHVWQNNRAMLTIGLAVLAVALFVILYVARQVATPLEKISTATEAIGRLEVEPRPVVNSIVLEVNRLGVAVEEMKTGLRSFRKYVPADLVRSLMQSGREASLGGEKRRVTVSFSDIVSFTTISEGMDPADLVEHLREYFNDLSRRIQETGGTVDKYIGDAIMSFWGAPAVSERHAIDACTCALRSQAALRELRAGWAAQGKPAFAARFGVNTGEVVVGNVGSEQRLNYTVIGDAVNVASRLEGLNKVFGTEILISEHTHDEARSEVLARPVERVAVKGKTEALLVYELLCLRAEAGEVERELVEVHAEGLQRYREREWSQAMRLFGRVLELRPGDGPARIMQERCRSFQVHPPGADWDAVERRTTK